MQSLRKKEPKNCSASRRPYASMKYLQIQPALRRIFIDKILSLYEQDVRILVRGKAGAEVEFGNALYLAEQADGLIVDYPPPEAKRD